MSKYKNPDRYIKALKHRIKMLENHVDFHGGQMGGWLFNLHCEQSDDRWGTQYDHVKPGDTIIALGTVDSVRLYLEDGKRANEVKFTIETLRHREKVSP